nr:homogentisate phytyltransferase 1, chloroplastic-like [Tanacetum cinerariifolium]
MLLVFSVVLILFKDIPDTKGDEMHGIKSLASQIGPELILGHMATILALWVRAISVETKSMASISSMYLFLWNVNGGYAPRIYVLISWEAG